VFPNPYLEWIDYTKRDNPSLRAEPFETYLQNREQLSSMIKEHSYAFKLNWKDREREGNRKSELYFIVEAKGPK
jgi:hypothetical protein